MTPNVSVIMPVHNGERYLRTAIESILGQTLTDLELIVIDDASVDRTAEIVYAINDERIVYLRCNWNRGQGVARNIGIQTAQGEFVAIQDSDDLSAPERLEKQVSFLRSNPDVGVVGTAFRRIRSGGKELGVTSPPMSDTELRWRLLFDTTFCHASVMIPRHLLIENGIQYRLSPPVEDYDFLLQLSACTKMANLRAPLYHYRIHTESVMARLRDKVEAATAKVSAGVLSSYLPEVQVTPALAAALRRCYFGKRIGPNEIAAARYMQALFRAFVRRPDVNTARIGELQSQWIERFMRSMPVRHWPVFLRSESLHTLIMNNRHATLKGFALAVFARTNNRLQRS